MVVAEKMKPIVKVSVSDSESSDVAVADGGESEYDAEVSDGSDQRNDNVSNSDNNDISESDEDGKSNSGDDVKNNFGADGVSESDEDAKSEPEDALMTNEGWADSLAKILGSSKPKNKKTLVLSRAKKHSEIKKEKDEKPSFEVIGEEVKEDKPEVKKESVIEPPLKKKKLDRPSIRVKPNILEKDRERLLSKIATKGVVQLFNAVRNQQKSLEKDMDNSVSETKREKILKKFDKRTFLDSLMGNTKSIVVDSTTKKDEIKNEEKPKWNALRDDFMMGAKMKDWDKESVDE